MTIEQREVLLKALDVLSDLQGPEGATSAGYVDIAYWALQDVLQVGPKWQEDGE